MTVWAESKFFLSNARNWETNSGRLSVFVWRSEGVFAAVKTAKERDLPLLCLGSLYLYGEFCDALEACFPAAH